MRARHLPAIAASVMVVLGACTSGADNTTTTSSQPATTSTTAQTTTSTVNTTSTTTPPPSTTEAEADPWSIDYPLDVDTVDDIPDVLTDRIGAPEPDPDLAVEGPDDVERWVDEWLGWFSWVNANPAEGIEALEGGVVPGGAFYEDTLAALETRRDEGTRLLGFAFVPMQVSGTFDEFFESRQALRMVVVASDTIPRYIVDGAGTVTVSEPLGGETTLALLLRYLEGEGEWILESLEVLG